MWGFPRLCCNKIILTIRKIVCQNVGGYFKDEFNKNGQGDQDLEKVCFLRMKEL